jgi:hypothetical protein
MSGTGGPPMAAGRSRWQFSLRTVFALTLASAALSAIYRIAPQLAVLALGISPAVWLMLGVFRNRAAVSLHSPLRLCKLIAAAALVYAVATGPAVSAMRRFVWAERLVHWLYVPLQWLYATSPLFRELLDWYVGYWRD